MSISEQKHELEDGLQVIEVGLSIEGSSDAGRVNEAITAHEPREVWGFHFGDPNGNGNTNTGEYEINVTRDQSSIERPEVSTQIADGASGYSINETVIEYGYHWDGSGFAPQNQWVNFPMPIIWQEDETWHFTGFLNNGQSDPEGFNEQEIRVYFAQPERVEAPYQSRMID